MYKILLPVLLFAYLIVKYRSLSALEKGPVEGMVLFPRQDARFVHAVMSVLLSIAVFEFISHPVRDQGAALRLLAASLLFVCIDALFGLKLKNQAIIYDRNGLLVRSLWGREQRYDWDHIKEVRSSGTGVRHARVITLKTKDHQTIRISEKSGGLERFRRFLEERI